MKNRYFIFTSLLLAIAPFQSSGAQTEIDIRQNINVVGRTQPVWVSMSGFTGEASEVLEFDLYVQGFGFTNAENAQYLISGSNDGNLEGRVHGSRSANRRLLAKAYKDAPLRRQAHAFADAFVEALGRKGIALTHIAFKVDTGRNSEIYVSDFDGHNPHQVTRDNSIVAAPSWVPGQFALYYTSYKKGNPAIFYHDLSSGERKTVAWYGGSSISPAVSPDGRQRGDDSQQRRQPRCVCVRC